jgi:glucose-6-phosphate 1-dehydrogenase
LNRLGKAAFATYRERGIDHQQLVHQSEARDKAKQSETKRIIKHRQRQQQLQKQQQKHQQREKSIISYHSDNSRQESEFHQLHKEYKQQQNNEIIQYHIRRSIADQ